jgi:NAD(P)-dependent dehydrogenase (short-subunit alcohol dehydrogenase family)
MAGSTQAEIPSQVGRTAVVTGATGALGYEAALALARAGAEVILSGRDAGKGQSAIERIGRDAIGAKVSYEHLDLANLASVTGFADWMHARPSLDLLIANAGGLGDLRGPPAGGLVMLRPAMPRQPPDLGCFRETDGYVVL